MTVTFSWLALCNENFVEDGLLASFTRAPTQHECFDLQPHAPAFVIGVWCAVLLVRVRLDDAVACWSEHYWDYQDVLSLSASWMLLRGAYCLHLHTCSWGDIMGQHMLWYHPSMSKCGSIYAAYMYIYEQQRKRLQRMVVQRTVCRQPVSPPHTYICG